MSSMLEFPTFEEMVAVMNSPSHPPEPMDYTAPNSRPAAEMELSAEDMIEEIFYMVKDIWKREQVETGSDPQFGGGVAEDAILMDNSGQVIGP